MSNLMHQKFLHNAEMLNKRTFFYSANINTFHLKVQLKNSKDMIKEFHVDSLQAFISGKLIKLSSSFKKIISPHYTGRKNYYSLGL